METLQSPLTSLKQRGRTMEESSTVEASSPPLATVAEIQSRLLRPPPIHSQSSIPSISSARDNLRKHGNSSSLSSPIDLKTLEDYLNPVLLSKVRAKLGGSIKRKADGGELRRFKYDRFEWPIDQLKIFKEVTTSTQRRNVEEETAVDLGNDTDDLIGDGGEGGEGCCTPFGKFEAMALKKFRGGG